MLLFIFFLVCNVFGQPNYYALWQNIIPSFTQYQIVNVGTGNCLSMPSSLSSSRTITTNTCSSIDLKQFFTSAYWNDTSVIFQNPQIKSCFTCTGSLTCNATPMNSYSLISLAGVTLPLQTAYFLYASNGAWAICDNGGSISTGNYDNLNCLWYFQFLNVQTSVTYSPASLIPISVTPIDNATICNGYSNIIHLETYTFETTTSSQFQWSLTEGLEIGLQFTFNAGLFGFGSSAQVSVKGSFSSTQQWAGTNTNSLTRTINYEVPPCTCTTFIPQMNLYSYSQTYTIVFSVGTINLGTNVGVLTGEINQYMNTITQNTHITGCVVSTPIYYPDSVGA